MDPFLWFVMSMMVALVIFAGVILFDHWFKNRKKL